MRTQFNLQTARTPPISPLNFSSFSYRLALPSFLLLTFCTNLRLLSSSVLKHDLVSNPNIIQSAYIHITPCCILFHFVPIFSELTSPSDQIPSNSELQHHQRVYTLCCSDSTHKISSNSCKSWLPSSFNRLRSSIYLVW